MTTIFERVSTALATLSPAIPYAMDVFEQIGDAALPAQFITFQLISGTRAESFDNTETMRAYRVQINIMSTSGLAVLPDVNTAMTDAGFQKSDERTLPKDAASGHYILSKDFIYLDVL